MTCPGSVRLSAQVSERRSSRYADEGTAAHQLAERCLQEWHSFGPGVPRPDASRRIGAVETVRNQPWEVTEEMAEAVQLFLDTVLASHGGGADTLYVEHRFDLSNLHPGMFGTNDACVVSPSRRLLHVLDYKHGKGHAVEAAGNPQLRYYALGALLTLPTVTAVSDVQMTIVQPRAPHRDGAVRSETISAFELLEWAGTLKVAAEATESPDAPLRAGEHCTFCPAAAVCPALRDRALEAAMADFAGATITVPAEPGVLTVEQLARLLEHADLIDDWLSAVRAHALHLAESGTPIPGFKLVPKRAVRKWRDDFDHSALMDATGLGPGQVYAEPKLLSPAQVEKLLPKDKRAALDALVVKESSGTNLVPDADPRQAKAPSVLTDFAGINL